MTPSGGASHTTGALEGLKLALDVTNDISDFLPTVVKPVIGLAKRVVTVAEVKRPNSSLAAVTILTRFRPLRRFNPQEMTAVLCPAA